MINVSGQVLRYKTLLTSSGYVTEDKSYARFITLNEDAISIVINLDSQILKISDAEYSFASNLMEKKGTDGKIKKVLICEDEESTVYTLTIEQIKDSEDFNIFFAGKVYVYKYRVKEIKSN